MRVGIVITPSDPMIGGRYSFQNSVLEGLERVISPHEIFLLITNGSLPRKEPPAAFKLVDLRACYGVETKPRQSDNGFSFFVSRLLNLIGLGKPVELSGNNKPPEPTLLGKAVEDLQLDVVWFADPECERVSVPFFATVWDLEHRKQPYFPEVNCTGWDWASREQHYGGILPRAARIFTGTQVGKDEIVHYYGINPANVVVNPFVAPRPATGPSSEADSEVLARHLLPPGFLLYPAQFWPHKNHVNLLHALKILQADHGLTPPLVLTGSDKGNLDYVRSVIADLGVSDRVHLLGFVPSADLEALYRHAALMVFPTFFGPDNIPPLEAFTLGCPAVVSDIPGAREQLGDAALYFDPARPDDMAAQIAKVFVSPDLKARLVRQGLAVVASRSPQGYVQTVFRVLDDFEPIRRSWRNDYSHT